MSTAVTFVVLHNFLLGCLCFYAAWKIWQFRKRLGGIADRMPGVEQAILGVINPIPPFMQKAHRSTQGARQRYQKLEVQVAWFQRVIVLLSASQTLWRQWQFLARRVNSARKTSSKSS